MDLAIIKKVLPPVQVAVLDILQAKHQRLQEQGYYLAGGTALALQLGHRQSVDFDFFSQLSGLGDATYVWLQALPECLLREKDADTVHAQVQGVKLSFIGGYKYAPVFEPVDIQNISIAHIQDIGAMKLLAITSRAALRDYIDIAAILKSGVSLAQLLEASEKKYGPSFNTMVPLRALAAHDDKDMDTEVPTLLDSDLERNWRDILDKAVQRIE